MLGGRRRTPVAGDVVENGRELFKNAVALGKGAAVVKRDPGSCSGSFSVLLCGGRAATPTLVFAISSLHLLVHALLDLALENAGASRLVEVGDLQDVGCIDPVVGAAAHNMVAGNIELVDGDLRAAMMSALAVGCVERDGRGQLTLL